MWGNDGRIWCSWVYIFSEVADESLSAFGEYPGFLGKMNYAPSTVRLSRDSLPHYISTIYKFGRRCSCRFRYAYIRERKLHVAVMSPAINDMFCVIHLLLWPARGCRDARYACSLLP